MSRHISLWDKALQLISRRDFSRAELISRLQQHAYRHRKAKAEEADESLADSELFDKAAVSAEIDSVVERLLEYGYLNDQRVAETAVRMGIAKGQGPRRIEAELKHKTLPKEALEQQDEEVDWFKQARDIRIRRFGENLPDTPKEKNRQLRFLLYRGFTQAQAMKALSINEWDE